jgi:hypothetical protein
MDSRVYTVLHNEILRVCEQVSLMARSWQQSINQPLLLDRFFLIIIQACCLHLPQNPQQSEERWSFCKNKNHYYNDAKFLHARGQLHQITMTLKNHKCSVLVTIS